jgi:hypothetical protein
MCLHRFVDESYRHFSFLLRRNAGSAVPHRQCPLLSCQTATSAMLSLLRFAIPLSHYGPLLAPCFLSRAENLGWLIQRLLKV